MKKPQLGEDIVLLDDKGGIAKRGVVVEISGDTAFLSPGGEVRWEDENVVSLKDHIDPRMYGELSCEVGKHARVVIALEIMARGESAPERMPASVALSLAKHWSRLGRSVSEELVSEWGRLWSMERHSIFKDSVYQSSASVMLPDEFLAFREAAKARDRQSPKEHSDWLCDKKPHELKQKRRP